MRVSIWEIIIIVILVVILFGSAKIPNMMKNIADGIKTFKKEIKTTTTKKTVESKKNSKILKRKTK